MYVLESSPNLPTSSLWKNCLPRNQFLVPKWLGTAVLANASLNGGPRRQGRQSFVFPISLAWAMVWGGFQEGQNVANNTRGGSSHCPII